MVFATPEQVRALTPDSPYERLPDGRPAVPDDLLARLKLVTTEEAWAVLEMHHGYVNQFEGDWFNLHPDRVIVGRAVTAAFVPFRPDLNAAVNRWGEANGRSGSQNTWIIDSLQPNDLLVADLFGKVQDGGTLVGDNLSTAVRNRTGTGLVIHGGIRDLQRIYNLTDFNIFCRGADPVPIRNVTLISVNLPVRIGRVTVLPGDIVLGTREGVTFIPPHLVPELVEHSEDTRLRDSFGQQRLIEGRYTSGQIDVSVWAEEIETDYQTWKERRGDQAMSARGT